MRGAGLAVVAALGVAASASACASIIGLDAPDPLSDETPEDASSDPKKVDASSGRSPASTSGGSTGSAGTSTASSGSSTADDGGSTSSSSTTSSTTSSSSSSSTGGPVTCDSDAQCTTPGATKCTQKNECRSSCVGASSQDGCSLTRQDACCHGLVCIGKGSFPFTECIVAPL